MHNLKVANVLCTLLVHDSHKGEIFNYYKSFIEDWERYRHRQLASAGNAPIQ